MKGGFLLDTNIPSELMRPRPEPRVKEWVAAQDMGSLFLSVVSIGELEAGLATMRDAERRKRLEASLERYLSLLFQGSILPVTHAVAARWGKLDGLRQMAGRPLSAPDGMIAATALEHGLTVVTRNVKDFDRLDVAIFNPWKPHDTLRLRFACFSKMPLSGKLRRDPDHRCPCWETAPARTGADRQGRRTSFLALSGIFTGAAEHVQSADHQAASRLPPHAFRLARDGARSSHRTRRMPCAGRAIPCAKAQLP